MINKQGWYRAGDWWYSIEWEPINRDGVNTGYLRGHERRMVPAIGHQHLCELCKGSIKDECECYRPDEPDVCEGCIVAQMADDANRCTCDCACPNKTLKGICEACHADYHHGSVLDDEL